MSANAKNRLGFRLGGLALSLLPIAALGQYQRMDVDPDVAFRDPRMSKIGIDQRLGESVRRDATFTDDEGRTVQFGQLLRGRPLIVLPIFYRCERTCYLELTGVIGVMNQTEKLRAGRDVDIVAVGINPTEPFQLARGKKRQLLGSYESLNPDRQHWRFLTGSEAETRKLTDSLGFRYTYDKAKNEVSHPSGIMVIAPSGRISSYAMGSNYDVTRFEKLVELAKRETITEPTKEIFFGCLHIDPVTGKRSIVIENVMRLLAIVTLAALLGTITWFNIRARRQRAAEIAQASLNGS
ncbi:MAG: SCO family protein [Fimbriimonadaceae bacterium]|nr:SCO family protein [Fimbriimonadaceae bacterium]